MTDRVKDEAWELLRTAHSAARKIRINRMRGENTTYSAEIDELVRAETKIANWLWPNRAALGKVE